MESAQGARKTSKYVPDDIISSMPDNVITNIMDRLPILDAVGTSVLSTKWRFKWTMVTQLVCDIDFFENVADEEKYGRIISWLLLNLKGPITKFSVYIQDECYFEDIHHWVMFLSGKGIKDFTLTNYHETPLKLPSRFFSCLALKHLELYNCRFHPTPSFRGFPNLLSLDLYFVSFESYDFGEFITQCPLLEILRIGYNTTCKMKEAEIAKLENLKLLFLPLCKLNNMTMMTSSSVIQLMSLLPKLQKLRLDFVDCKLLADGKAWLPNVFPCLKSLKLWRIDFSSETMVSCAIELICSSPNLHSLEIRASYNDEVLPSAVCSSKVDYSKIGQLQLRKVGLEFFRGSEIEICLIKYLLCFSPLLKNLKILCESSEMFGGESGGRMFATKLLKFLRASPTVEIDLIWL